MLVWLQHVLQQQPNAIFKKTHKEISTLNINSFVRGVLSNEPDDLLPEPAECFVDTLAILMDAEHRTIIHRHPFEKGLSELLAEPLVNSDDKVAEKLRKISEAIFPTMVFPITVPAPASESLTSLAVNEPVEE